MTARWPYLLLFTAGLGAWAAVFWALRRRPGPITFVERQLAHSWGSGVLSINLLFLTEWLLGLPVLTPAPVWGITNGMLFLIKGGILSGAFYVYAAAAFALTVPMALYPRFGPLLFGVVTGVCSFLTGLRYLRRRLRARRPVRAGNPPGVADRLPPTGRVSSGR